MSPGFRHWGSHIGSVFDEKQVSIEKLSAAAINRFRTENLSTKELSKQALEEVVALVVMSLARAILPNKLLQALRAFRRQIDYAAHRKASTRLSQPSSNDGRVLPEEVGTCRSDRRSLPFLRHPEPPVCGRNRQERAGRIQHARPHQRGRRTGHRDVDHGPPPTTAVKLPPGAGRRSRAAVQAPSRFDCGTGFAAGLTAVD